MSFLPSDARDRNNQKPEPRETGSLRAAGQGDSHRKTRHFPELWKFATVCGRAKELESRRPVTMREEGDNLFLNK